MGIPADIIIYALIAGYAIYRLYSVLGTKTGEEGKNNRVSNVVHRNFSAAKQAPAPIIEDEILQTKPVARIELSADLDSKVQQLQQIDSEFDAAEFLQGAKMAYEMVFAAYNSSDKSTLKDLLSAEVFQEFSKLLEQEKNSDIKKVTTIVSIKKAEFLEVELNGSTAQIEIEFTTEQFSKNLDKDKNTIESSTTKIELIKDSWVFERDLTSRNPNWVVVST